MPKGLSWSALQLFKFVTRLLSDYYSDEKRHRTGKIIGWSIGVSVMLILSVIVLCFWKRRQKQAKADAVGMKNFVEMEKVF